MVGLRRWGSGEAKISLGNTGTSTAGTTVLNTKGLSGKARIGLGNVGTSTTGDTGLSFI